MLFTQKVAFTLLKKGERGLGMLVDYTSQIIAEAAADFILQQGGWVITDPMAKKNHYLLLKSPPPTSNKFYFIYSIYIDKSGYVMNLGFSCHSLLPFSLLLGSAVWCTHFHDLAPLINSVLV